MIESLIAIAVMSLVLPACFTFFLAFQRQVLETAAVLEAENSAQAILGRLALLIQQAGNNPWGISLTPFHRIHGGSFYIESDANGGAGDLPDGALDGNYEQVLIEWDETTRQVYQRSGHGSRQPLASGVRLLEIQGIDKNGLPTNNDGEVVWVELHIVTEAPLLGPKGQDLQTTEWTGRIPLLSRQ